jgi:threonine/homoserine/homoserine lactone efflux protein
MVANRRHKVAEDRLDEPAAQGNKAIVLSSLQLVPAGVAIGLLAAAPVGPVNIFVIQRTLARGFGAGFAAGLGAVLGDGMIAAVAAFGLTATEEALAAHERLIQFVGGLVLLGFGLKLLLYPAQEDQPPDEAPALVAHAGAIPQTFFMTVTNPGAILGMFAVIGGLISAVGGFDSAVEPCILVLSIVAGNLLWWLGLTRLIHRIHHRLSAERLTQINRIAGMLLAASGMALIAHLAATSLGLSG